MELRENGTVARKPSSELVELEREARSLAFDLSFSDDHFEALKALNKARKELKVKEQKKMKELEMATFSGDTEVRKLRFEYIRRLRLNLLKTFSRMSASLELDEAKVKLKDVFTSEEFSDSVFGLLNLDGSSTLDSWEVLANNNDPEDGNVAAQEETEFKAAFAKLFEVHSGGFDVVTKETFREIWGLSDLYEKLVLAINQRGQGTIDIKTTLEFIILFTNPK